MIQIVVVALYPLLVHLLIWQGLSWLAVAALVAMNVIGLLALRHARSAIGLWAGYLLLAGFGIVNLLSGAHSALFVPPVLIHLALAVYFAASLRVGQTPLIERIMRVEFTSLPFPSTLQAYARSLTVFWAAYFTGVAVVSVVLALAAQLETWSLFVNILNFAIMAALIAAQHLYRLFRYRDVGSGRWPWAVMRDYLRHAGK